MQLCGIAGWQSDDLFVKFRQLPTNAYWSFAKYFTHCCEGFLDSVGCFEKNYHSLLNFNRLEPQKSVVRPSWGEAEKHEAISRHSGDDKSGNNCAGAGHRNDGDALRDSGRDESLSRVGNHWSACIGHECQVLSLRQLPEQDRKFLSLVVYVKAGG